jgi:retron-type reverse transcriptase
VKTYKNLYEKIYDFENLYQAYLCARKCKRYRNEVLAFTANLEANLISIQNDLIWQTYRVGHYREFYVYEPKKRLIMALPFRDRVVQWAVFRVINPIFARGYISDSYASIDGRGTQSAVKKIQYWLKLAQKRPQKYYYLKMDVAKFFYRISHEAILKIISRKIADPKVMWLFDTIINSEDTAFGLPLGKIPVAESTRLYDVGMPIGNLTSQMMANIYMNEVDQYCKRKLRIRCYMRYMDDMLILSESKERLHEYKRLVEQFLNEKLKLELNNKTAIRPCSLGIEFCGYRVWVDHIKLRKSTALRMKRRLNHVREQYSKGKISLEKANEVLTSYLGLMSHCDSYRLKSKILKDYVLVQKEHPD